MIKIQIIISVNCSENPFLKANLRKNHWESEVIGKYSPFRIYGNYTINKKINPVKEDKQIDSFIEDNSIISNQIKNINTGDKSNLFFNRE